MVHNYIDVYLLSCRNFQHAYCSGVLNCSLPINTYYFDIAINFIVDKIFADKVMEITIEFCILPNIMAFFYLLLISKCLLYIRLYKEKKKKKLITPYEVNLHAIVICTFSISTMIRLKKVIWKRRSLCVKRKQKAHLHVTVTFIMRNVIIAIIKSYKYGEIDKV